jgi:hypothetical protein
MAPIGPQSARRFPAKSPGSASAPGRLLPGPGGRGARKRSSCLRVSGFAVANGKAGEVRCVGEVRRGEGWNLRGSGSGGSCRFQIARPSHPALLRPDRRQKHRQIASVRLQDCNTASQPQSATDTRAPCASDWRGGVPQQPQGKHVALGASQPSDTSICSAAASASRPDPVPCSASDGQAVPRSRGQDRAGHHLAARYRCKISWALLSINWPGSRSVWWQAVHSSCLLYCAFLYRFETLSFLYKECYTIN